LSSLELALLEYTEIRTVYIPKSEAIIAYL